MKIWVAAGALCTSAACAFATGVDLTGTWRQERADDRPVARLIAVPGGGEAHRDGQNQEKTENNFEIRVRDFGVRGDGVTKDTVAIQRAIDDYSIGQGDDETAEKSFAWTLRKLRLMTKFASKHGKVAVISETGVAEETRRFLAVCLSSDDGRWREIGVCRYLERRVWHVARDG